MEAPGEARNFDKTAMTTGGVEGEADTQIPFAGRAAYGADANLKGDAGSLGFNDDWATRQHDRLKLLIQGADLWLTTGEEWVELVDPTGMPHILGHETLAALWTLPEWFEFRWSLRLWHRNSAMRLWRGLTGRRVHARRGKNTLLAASAGGFMR